MARKVLYSLALSAFGVACCSGCVSQAVDRPAYPNPSWTDKVGSAMKSGATKVTAALSPKPTTDEPEPLTGNPGPASLVALAKIHEESGNLEAAEESYQKALAMDSDYLPALLGYAHIEESRHNYDAAMKHYNRALKKHPKEATVHNDVGLCYHRRGKLAEATKELEKAVELKPQRKLYRSNLAAVLVEQGRTDEALAQLVFAHEPGVAHYNLGYLLVQQHRNAEALLHFRAALEKDPSLVEAQQWIARIAPAEAGVRVALPQVMPPGNVNAAYTMPGGPAGANWNAAPPQAASLPTQSTPVRLPQVIRR